MADKKLVEYLKSAQSKGFGDKEITNKLLEIGYDTSSIAAAYDEIRTGKKVSSSPKRSLILAGLILLVAVCVGLYLVVVSPRINHIENNELLNIYYDESVSETNLISRFVLLNELVSKCSSSGEFELTGKEGCSAINLFVLSRKFINYSGETVSTEDRARITLVKDWLDNTKKDIMGRDTTFNSTDKRYIISSLLNFGMISKEDKEILTHKYFSSFDQDYLKTQNCLSYWDQVMYFKDILGINSKLEVTKEWSGDILAITQTCEEIRGSEYVDFCRDPEKGEYPLCYYNKYLRIKIFCQEVTKEDLDKGDALLVSDMAKLENQSFCVHILNTSLEDYRKQ